ncbi:MAG: tripartite tricarboxylate transporter substrate-binding protein [Actinomycetota bacterium]|nr:tripartite tricarboxylate transporter substrate-binding protein [Actinomycetota bacterium]
MPGACGGGGAGEDYPEGDIEIMAPADPGGGWDQTARAMQSALTEGGVIDENVEVYNVGGAGGTIGLAEFVSDNAGDPNQLMVMGLVMLGAIQTNDSPVDLSQTTPIASLLTEWEAIVVPAGSEYQTLEQLVEDFKADPGSISWAGGSAGSTDQVLIGLLAQEVGVDPAKINYIAHSGGGEANAAILSGSVSAGVTGLAEVIDQVEAGQMRLLAVSSDEPIEGVNAPTIVESGYDVTLPNWRGVVAPPDISDEDREAIIAMIEQMHDSPEWQETLETNNWTDFFQTGDEFAAYLDEEHERVSGVLSQMGLA